MCAFLLGWMNRCFFCCIHCFQYRQQRRRNRRALQQWRTLQDQFDTVANMHVPHQPSQPDGSIQNNEDNGSNEVMLDANTIVEELFVQALLFCFMSHERVRHNDQIIPANTELHHGDGDDEESMYQLNNSSSRSSPNIEMVTRNSDSSTNHNLFGYDLQRGQTRGRTIPKLFLHTKLFKEDNEITAQSNKINCSICLSEFSVDDIIATSTVESGNCTHEFHEDCIKDWLKRENNCPLCKQVFASQTFSEVIDENDDLSLQIEQRRQEERIRTLFRAVRLNPDFPYPNGATTRLDYFTRAALSLVASEETQNNNDNEVLFESIRIDCVDEKSPSSLQELRQSNETYNIQF